MSRWHRSLYIVALLAFSFVTIAMIPERAAAAGYCSTGWGGLNGCQGYFTGRNASATFGTVENILSGGLRASSGSAFISTVRGNLNSGSTQNSRGGAFIVAMMLGHGPFGSPGAGISWAKNNFSDFVDLVNAYDNAPSGANYGIKWNVMVNPNRNSAYFTDIQDDAFHTNSSAAASIDFYNGGDHFQIERACGNLLGELVPPKMPKNWKIKVSSSVDRAKAAPGTSVTWTHKVMNVGTSESDVISGVVKWGSEGIKTGATSVDYSRKIKPSNPVVKTYNFTIPSGANDGDKFCQFITADKTSDSSGANMNSDSDDACVIVASWEMTGKSSVAQYAKPGTSVTFSHYVKNIGDRQSPTITGQVYWGKVGAKTSGSPSPTGYYSHKFDPGQRDNASNSFSIPAGATPGTQYCQYITWSKSSSTDNSTGSSASACVTVTAASPPASITINLSPSVNGGPDVEPGDSAPFNGNVGVYTFPAMNQWGYTEYSKQAKGSRVAINAYSIGTTVNHNYYCPHPHDTYVGGGTCYHDRKAYTKKADCLAAGYSWSGSCYNYHAANDNPTYSCPGGYIKESNSTCTSYSCSVGWVDYSASPPRCNGWTCPGGYTYSQSSQPTCPEYRCNAGYGSYAQGGSPWYSSPCYITPSFTFVCVWDTGDSTTATVTPYTPNPTCNTSTSKTAGPIGSTICASLTAIEPSGWSPSFPAPGYGSPDGGTTYYQMSTWGWSGGTASGCTNVIGKPYLKVYGSDARVGGGVMMGSDTSTCFNNDAEIRAFNRYDTAGAGAQYAVMAMGMIDQFGSAQYNNFNATPSYGAQPTQLTFANTSFGSGYGVGWGAAPPCVDYVGNLPSTATTTSGNTSYGARTISGEVVEHVVGDVYLGGNITYDLNGWAKVEDIPTYRLVVEGNIYVGSNVTQLDGTYVAVPTSSSSGQIYTCASGMGSPVTGTFSTGCTNQLVVNGAFVAKKVLFERDCSTIRYANRNEPTVYTGGSGDNQNCSPQNRAAEVFNYTPELWIRSSSGKPKDKYDAITSLPPVL